MPALLLLIIQHAMAISLEFRIRDLLLELLAHTLDVLAFADAARAVPVLFRQSLPDGGHAFRPLTLLRSAPNGRPAPAKGISDGGLTPATDTNMLLTAYKDWSHSSSDITQTGHKHKGTRLISSSPSPTCSFGNVPSPTEFCPPRQDKCRRTPPAPANSGRRFPPPPAESRRTT